MSRWLDFVELNRYGLPGKSSSGRALVTTRLFRAWRPCAAGASPRFCSRLSQMLSALLRLFQNTASKMNSLRFVRPLASKFTTTSLPRIARPYSVATSSSYEHLLVSTPRPGVTLSMPASLPVGRLLDPQIYSDRSVSPQSRSTAPKP